MKLGWIIMALSISGLGLGCDRNSDQISPKSKVETETGKAQDYPSTRNGENPDASIGGTNSATSRPGNQTPTTPANPPPSGS